MRGDLRVHLAGVAPEGRTILMGKYVCCCRWCLFTGAKLSPSPTDFLSSPSTQHSNTFCSTQPSSAPEITDITDLPIISILNMDEHNSILMQNACTVLATEPSQHPVNDTTGIQKVLDRVDSVESSLKVEI